MSGLAAVDEKLNRLRRELQRLREQVGTNAREIEELRTIGRDHAVLDVDGCAELLGVSPRTVERRVQDGRIPFVKVGGEKNVRFIRADILSWLRRGAPPSRTPRLSARPSGTQGRKRPQAGASLPSEFSGETP